MSETTELIKRLRERGLSQTEIARRTGIPQPRLSRWENGEVPDAADDALKLAALVADDGSILVLPLARSAPVMPPIDIATAASTERRGIAPHETHRELTPFGMGIDRREHGDAELAVERTEGSG